MHGSYGLNNFADQRQREERAEARRHRLALDAEAAGIRVPDTDGGSLRRLTGRAAVAVRWAIRAVLG